MFLEVRPLRLSHCLTRLVQGVVHRGQPREFVEFLRLPERGVQACSGLENLLGFGEGEAGDLVGAMRTGDFFDENDEGQTVGAAVGVIGLRYSDRKTGCDLAIEVHLAEIEAHGLRQELVFGRG